MIELVFFGLVGILGLFIGEVAKSRKAVEAKKVETKLVPLKRLRVRMHIRNK